MNQTPRELGFRWPAEWEPHEGTLLSWPNPTGISFPGSYQKVLPTYIRMIELLSEVETVFLNISHPEQQKEITQRLSNKNALKVKFLPVPTQEPWCRDHGPIFVTKENKRALTDWGYNAWGEKYQPFNLDNDVPKKIAELFSSERFIGPMVLEGGSIDGNGKGAVLTTTSCLLNPNRNPSLSKNEIEENIRRYLNVSDFIWLGEGIEGDDTDGHIDDITRFVTSDTLITMVEDDTNDFNHEPLKANLNLLTEIAKIKKWQVVEIPMPAKLEREDLRLPCSYANFYIANEIVLLPTFNCKNDDAALSILRELFPNRDVIGVDCRELIWGLGAFHCLTQQVPKI